VVNCQGDQVSSEKIFLDCPKLEKIEFVAHVTIGPEQFNHYGSLDPVTQYVCIDDIPAYRTIFRDGKERGATKERGDATKESLHSQQSPLQGKCQLQ